MTALPGRWTAGLGAAFRDLCAFLWPGPCPLCGRDLPEAALAGFCPACWAGLPARSGGGCLTCDLPLVSAEVCPDCRAFPGPSPLRRTVTAFHYVEGVITLHRRLKFEGQDDLVSPLAARMAAAWRQRGADCVNLVVPVPPDPLRLPPRRFTTRRLARAVAEKLELPWTPRGLFKLLASRSQTLLPAPERRRAMAGRLRGRKGLVAGFSILLVDDVVTTTGTLREAARALLAAGAVCVQALALARTPPV